MSRVFEYTSGKMVGQSVRGGANANAISVNGTGPINPTWYIGKPQDTTTGLVYFGARWFDPITGRFLGFDPAGVTDENPHSFNRYAYGNNNPYKYLDPDGRESDLAQHSPAPQTAASAWSQAAKAMSNAVAEFGKAWMNASATFFGLVGGSAPFAAGKAAVVVEPVVVVGKKTIEVIAKDGTAVVGYTKHGINMAISGDGKRGGTSAKAILDTLKNPKTIKNEVDKKGRPATVYKGDDARVVVNPTTGEIISVNPLGRAGVR